MHPAARYPVAFGPTGALVGVAATRDIALSEAYCYVPMKCCINESKFRADPQIGHLLDKHPELFDESENASHIVVIFFVMYELGKGADSFWHSYFEISAWSDMPALWS